MDIHLKKCSMKLKPVALKVLLALLIIYPAGVSLNADVIRLNDGRIFIGKIISSDSRGLTFEMSGERKTVDQSSVLKTEPDFASLQNQSVEVVLKDGSVIKGKITDYDEEIGLLIDIEFGSLTVPQVSMKVIEDPVQRNYYNGYPVNIGISGGYYFSPGGLGADFENSFAISAFGEFKTSLMRGLFAGIGLSYYFVDYTASGDLSYRIVSAVPYAMYRILVFRSAKSFIRNFVPHVSLGTGISYVAVHDNRAGADPENFGEMNLTFVPGAGIDYYVTSHFLVRLKGEWVLIAQKSSALNLVNINLGGAYCF